ncbi:YlqD family protein [Leptolyngbya sp. PCC 6406]|uniref:YlqD family protein n=1 Tax=Leptolyngbya sp. PCC 6406 TaxID=1173264 RepID=UPI0002ACE667|nr:YlqD family protein [Leptolyngbya sp. PCC 6406]
MDVSPSSLTLKRPITVKAVVTPLWKEEAQKQLQGQINQIDGNLQQLEIQGQRMISELQKQGNTEDPNLAQQVSNVQNKLNQDKSQLLQQKNQILQQLQQVQTLELNNEVSQGQMESFFQVNVGDNLIRKMQVEILLRDGIIEEIRGEM